MELLDAILHDRFDGAEASLRGLGLRDPRRAFDNCRRMLARLTPPEFGRLFDFLLEGLPASADPDRALNNLERYQHLSAGGLQPAWLARERPYLLRLILDLFGFSQFLSDVLIRYPHYTAWLGDADILDAEPDTAALERSLLRSLAPFSSPPKRQHAAVRWLRRELLRSGLRVMTSRTDEPAFALELSRIAIAVIRVALAECERPLRQRFGPPMTEPGDPVEPPAEVGFAVVAMGKLGGMELNFSSDVDLVFVYGDEGRTRGVPDPSHRALQARISNHDYFRRLAEALLHFLSEPTEEGYLYRVDTRLRPDGAEGPLARSLGAFETYYETSARPWERMALVKARAIAGDPALGDRFDAMSLGLVFGRAMGPEIIDEVRDLKHRIDAGVEAGEDAGREIKRGHGGIREIEFYLQALQLLHGARHPDLRVRSTLELIPALAARGCLVAEDAGRMAEDYAFLRRVEHRLQMMDLRQTHTLPDDPVELDGLARRCGLAPSGEASPGECLLRRWETIAARVHARFVDFFGRFDDPSNALAGLAPAEHLARLIAAGAPDRDLIPRLAPHGLESGGALVALRRMGGRGRSLYLSPRAIDLFPAVLAHLLDAAPRSARPASALIHLEALISAFGSYAALYEIFAARPRLLELLLRAFGLADGWARTLTAHPQYLDAIISGEPWAEPADAPALRPRLAAALAHVDAGGPDALAAPLSRFRRVESLMTGLAEIALPLPFDRVALRLTDLADVVVEAILLRAAAPAEPSGFAVLAMGKHGSRELNHYSDLDLVFAWNDAAPGVSAESAHRLAAGVVATLTHSTVDGAPYPIDTRLRPEGAGAPLAPPRSRFLDYYATRARLWEFQSFMKVRPVAGDAAFAASLIEEVSAVLAARLRREFDDAALARGVRDMRLRLEASVKTPSWVLCDFKKGPGGLLDLDFLAQYFQLLALRDTGTRVGLAPPAVFDHASARGHLEAGEAAAMTRDYALLRQVESRARLLFETESSRAPAGGEKADAFARALADLFPDRPGDWRGALQDMLARNRRRFDRLLPPEA